MAKKEELWNLTAINDKRETINGRALVDGFNFEELDVYRAARAFKIRIYKLVALLPEKEKYKLCTQMPKAALSMTNCIAEGHGRYTYRDRRHFCIESRGSLAELVDDINDCQDNGYAKAEHLANLREDATKLNQILNGYIRYLNEQIKQSKCGKKSDQE